jgi:hypothetical protein
MARFKDRSKVTFTYKIKVMVTWKLYSSVSSTAIFDQLGLGLGLRLIVGNW